MASLSPAHTAIPVAPAGIGYGLTCFPPLCAGFVLKGRVMATLAVARALGDHQFKDPNLPWGKQMVSAVPDVTFIDRRNAADDFLIIACDGIFDVMNNESAVSFVRAALGTGASLKEVATRLIRFALKRGSTDNLSVIIVDVRPNPRFSTLVAQPRPARTRSQQFSSSRPRPPHAQMQTHTVLPPIVPKLPPPGISASTEAQVAALVDAGESLAELDTVLASDPFS